MLFPLNYKPEGGEIKALNTTTDGYFEVLYSEEYSGVVKHGFNIIWHGNILVYFLFGFHSMTTKVGNAFKSRKDSPGYATVGETETETNSALIALYRAKREFQGTYETLLTTRGKVEDIFTTERMKDRSIFGGVDGTFGGGGESKGDSVSLLTNRRKLYV